MIREVLENSNLTFFAVAGLVIFVAIFAGMILWVLTRKRSQVERWSKLPLHTDDEPPHLSNDAS